MAEPARDLIPYFRICNEETVSMFNRVVCSFNVFFIITALLRVHTTLNSQKIITFMTILAKTIMAFYD